MNNLLFDKEQVRDLIKDGKKLILAGDEKILSQLPSGDWIGGTIPYFMGPDGGFFSKDLIYVTEVPGYAISSKIKVYNKETIHGIYEHAPEKGFSLIIIPASCPTHLSFALNSANYKGFATKPLIGWISGVYLDELGKLSPKVFNGNTLEPIDEGAVVFHVELPKNKIAEIQTINLFSQGKGDVITFPKDGFSAQEAFINGQKVNFTEYLIENQIDLKHPLVANVYGEMINTSFQSIDETNRQVNFYAPVFTGVRYKIAEPIGDYVQTFQKMIPEGLSDDKIYFTCNCILNYLYAQLEGKKTSNFTGPITFGEIAYQLLNQTFAFITINDV
jgi:hypothetical protein